jgi:hypothetical protein
LPASVAHSALPLALTSRRPKLDGEPCELSATKREEHCGPLLLHLPASAPQSGGDFVPKLSLRTVLILAVAGLLLLVGPLLVTLYIDWLWFGEVGYKQVFLRTLSARAWLGGAVFLFAFAVLYANLRLAQKTLKRSELTIMTPQGPHTIAVDLNRIKPLLYGAVVLAAFLLAASASARWDVWLMARHAVPFGTSDPILGRDVSFYVFQLPLLKLVQSTLFMTVLLATIGVAVLHRAGHNLTFDPGRGILVTATARRHLSWLAAALLLLMAFNAWLGVPELLTRPGGIVHGASYVDVYARMPVQWILVVVACVGAILAVYQATVTRFWPILAAVGLYVGVAIAGSVYAAILQRFFVAPNEQVRESPYIAYSIAATRAGFALDRVVERQVSGETRLTREDIERNSATLDNVPLWNERPLLDTFGQIQEIRTYYDFVSVDNDRYLIDGEYRQIMLSSRELNSESLPSRTWINERLTFTHGYGLTLGPVNEVTREGLPVLFLKDLPLVSTVDLQVTQPSIYYGELSNDHVFVKTATPEFDYPKGDDNVFGRYEGDGGVEIGGLLRRALFAIRFGSANVLVSPSLTAESRVLMYRRISERVRRIAPFLRYDSDPYLAISDGRLVWIQDAYTTSTRYPYSTPTLGDINYIRNSIKVTVDAYHGSTAFHLVDANDPIAATLSRVFPGLVRPLSEMPEDLRTRLRYPQGIFSLQAATFATFHMTNPSTLYNREDQWEIPPSDLGEKAAPMAPYYTIMKLPGESGPEFIQMLPYTPRQKDNLAAWMVARSDGENYGQLMVFQLPKQTVVFGPRQIAARINQDQIIAPQITLWNQQGSEVIQGALLVIPIEESLLYIRPLYLRAAGGRIPELKRVIVAHQNRIVMEETLDAALDRLFPTDAPRRAVAAAAPGVRAVEPAASAAIENLAARARVHYERAMQAQREGDWAQYGEEIRRLGEVLERLNARR